ncbi:hypothetical protein DW972_03220 [Anaerobutyricum hallii]|uniref:Uncharacterized protein n=2 Tax=Anaerobutyricum hallii TaxID=39488 RepID=C0EZJ1_9FIRM|nr:hypothetical protein EUBHAL_02852 [Anaerobutyricum hallii DSM 3353]RGZ85431.1 hypothetical protein DW972_03220 [Anaerobutyricum hallii]
MFASTLTFNPRSKATNIGCLLSSGAVLWLGMELLLLLFPGYPGKLVERFGKEVRRDRNNPGNQILQD